MKLTTLPKFDGDFVLIQPAKNSSSEAAKLLLKVREIAMRELSLSSLMSRGLLVQDLRPKEVGPGLSSRPDVVVTERERSASRLAKVSSPEPTVQTVNYHVVTPPLAPKKYKSLPGPMDGGDDVMSISSMATPKAKPTIRKLLLEKPTPVLTKCIDQDKKKPSIRAVLRPKFSWKTYPELENYLIEHRSRYLEFSSEKNYTRDQKRYNNKLTQGLLALAEESGYVFDGFFTFAAIRDRIRCVWRW